MNTIAILVVLVGSVVSFVLQRWLVRREVQRRLGAASITALPPSDGLVLLLERDEAERRGVMDRTEER